MIPRKLLTALVLISLVAGLMAGAATAATPAEEAAALLVKFGIVQGDERGLRPDDSITRAEVSKILVAAAGLTAAAEAAAARAVTGTLPFADLRDHWAAGYVAVAKEHGWVSGYDDGTFKPQRNVTFAEMVTLLVRFVGLIPAPGPWPDTFIDAAQSAGIVDSKLDVRAQKSLPASRGAVFMLSDNAFTRVPVGTNNQNMYQKNFDTTPPVLKLLPVQSPTTEERAAIQGTVNGHQVLTVNGREMVVAPSGFFATVVDLALGENTVAVQARDEVGNVAAETVRITRAGGGAARIEAPATLEVAAGGTATVSAVVQDASGKPVPGATISAEVQGGVGTYNVATGQFAASATPGTGKLILTSGPARAEVAVTVKAGAVARVEVTPATATVRVGTAQKFTAKAFSASGQEVTGVTQVWSTDSNKGIVDASGNFIASSSGVIQVRATVGGVTGQATVTATGSAAKLAIGPLGELVANGKSTQQVTVIAQDADGNLVGDYAGTITLRVAGVAYAGFPTASGVLDTGVTSQQKTPVGGTASFTLVSSITAGDTVLSATGSGLTGATATLSTKSQTISALQVTSEPEKLAADGVSGSTIKARLLDQAGKPYVGTNVSGWTATFTTSDGTVVSVPGTTVPATADTTNGAYMSITATASYNIGSATVSATVRQGAEVKYTGGASVSTVIVGEPYRLMASGNAEGGTRQVGGSQVASLDFLIQDVNGNQVTRITDFTNFVLSLSANDNSYTAVANPNSPNVNSNATILSGGVAVSASSATISAGKITLKVASGKAQTVQFTLSGTYRGVNLQAGTASATFLPGTARTLHLKATPAAATAGGGGDAVPGGSGVQGTLEASVRDNADQSTSGVMLSEANIVTGGTYDITFSRAAGSTTLWSGNQTIASSNGVASVPVPTAAAVGTDTFVASYKPDGTNLVNSQWAYMRVAVVGGAYRLDISTYPTPASPAVAGTDHTVLVKVKDAQGTPETVATDNTTTVTLALTDSSGVNRGSWTATAVKGVATFNVTGLTRSGTFTATATAAGLQAGTRADYTVNPAAAAKLVGSLSATTMAASGDSTATLTVYAADAYDNKRTDALSGVTVTSSGSDVVAVSGTCPGSGDTCTFTLTGTVNVGTVTITTTKSGLTSYSGSVTTVISGDAKNAVVSVDQGGSVGSLSSSDTAIRQRIRVRLTDANGNQVTQSGKQQWVRLVAEGDGYNAANLTLYEGATITSNSQLKNWVQSVGGIATFYVNTNRAGTVTYIAHIVATNGSDTAVAGTLSGSSTGTFTAGAVNKITITAPAPPSIPGDGSSIATVTAKVTDAYGNFKPLAGTFRFTLSSLSHVYLSGAATDGALTMSSGDGQAAAMVQARTVTIGATVTITATFTPSDATVSLPGGASATSAALNVTVP